MEHLHAYEGINTMRVEHLHACKNIVPWESGAPTYMWRHHSSPPSLPKGAIRASVRVICGSGIRIFVCKFKTGQIHSDPRVSCI